jgi:hypothetical protein
LLGSILPLAVSGEDTNQVVLVTFIARGDAMECKATKEQILAVKKWDISKSAIPLEPKKAYDIAEAAMQKWFRGTSLIRMEILPLGTRSQNFDGHYCYNIEFSVFDGIRINHTSVVVLMDGTLILPKPVVH